MSSNSPIQSEFPITPIGFGANFISGYAFKSQDFCEKGLPVIKIKNIQDRIVTTASSQCVLPDLITEKLKKFLLDNGDVLIAMTGQGSVGRVGRLQCVKNMRPAMNQRVGKFVADEASLHKDFLYYVISSETFENHLFAMGSGSGQPNLSPAAILSVGIPQPAYQEQVAIAEILNALDDRIALLCDTNTTLEAIAQALFKSWFVDFDPVRAKQEGREPEGMDADTAALFPDSFEESELGLVPKGWRVGTVADIGEVICGKTPPTSEPANYGDDVPFITIPDMHNLLAVTSTNRSLSTLGANTQKKKTLPPGSICVSCIATAGLVVRVTTPSQTNQQINSVVPFTKWGYSFPLFTLRRIGDAVRAGGSGGSVFHNLSKSGFEKLKVLFPIEQLTVVFGEIIEPIIEKIIKNQKQAQTLATLRDTLLPRLISGQLRLPDVEALIEEATA
ncbi:MAG: restriction endonuclease subunit S [Desulfuromonadales bacterium]|nr:restriction endonuclease subunit S [Desulfuromonadales bacterium]